MNTFIPMTKAPSYSDKNFIHTSSGGYNRCIEIDDGSCLPNCVGYCWGRWRFLLGYDPKLSRNNAENWWGYTSDGYKRGQTPKLAAVMCWRKGIAGVSSDGAGHVAIVEQIKPNGDIVASESDYYGARWQLKTYTKSSGYYLGRNFTFQGFIYIPIDFDEDEPSIKVEDTPEKIYAKGDYRVTDASLLHVRKGPGTSYAKKKYSEFTRNARAQIYELVRYKADGYVMGVEFTVSEVKNNWGKTPSGWVCLDYCTKI